MANHLTPDELSKEYDLKREDVIRLCHEQAVPIYHGKIDKSLFAAVTGGQRPPGSAGDADRAPAGAAGPPGPSVCS